MTSPRFDGRVAVLTGVSKVGQVGEAVARALAERGAHVVAVDRSGDADARARELRDAGHSASALSCDLTDVDAVDRMVAELRAAHEGIDAFVHMAGGFVVGGPVADSDPTLWHRAIAINLTSAYVTTRALLPLLRERGGSIVYFASVAVLPGGRAAEMAGYAAAKAGVVALTRAVAQEERSRGIRANALAPSAIRTATNEASMGEDARYVEREDVVSTVLFLCSPAANAITGQVVRLG
jgi:3-oxoacyl-[acyl-carrier protein] reductase